MAVFSLEIADADVERVLLAVSSNYGWEPTVRNPAYPLDDRQLEVKLEVQLDEAGNPVLDGEGNEVLVPVLDENGIEVLIFSLDEFGNEITFDPVDGEGNPIPKEIPNPETMGDFTHHMVRDFLGSHVKSYETKVAQKQMLENLDIQVDISDPDPDLN